MKQLLKIENVYNGRLMERANQALVEANRLLEESENDKGVSKVVITLSIKNGDADGYFRELTADVKVTGPATAKRTEILPVQTIDGVRGIVTEPNEPIPDQPQLPGIASIAEKRVANQ